MDARRAGRHAPYRTCADHLDLATAHRPARSADPAVVVGRRRHLHRPRPDRRIPPRLRRGQPARLARARAGRGGRGRRDRASGRGRVARSGAANRGRVVRPDPVGPVPLGIPDAVVDAIVKELAAATSADHVVVARRRPGSRVLDATLVSSRPGVPDSTTILPVSDLEERIDRSADRQRVAAEPVAIPIEPEPSPSRRSPAR